MPVCKTGRYLVKDWPYTPKMKVLRHGPVLDVYYQTPKVIARMRRSREPLRAVSGIAVSFTVPKLALLPFLRNDEPLITK